MRVRSVSIVLAVASALLLAGTAACGSPSGDDRPGGATSSSSVLNPYQVPDLAAPISQAQTTGNKIEIKELVGLPVQEALRRLSPAKVPSPSIYAVPAKQSPDPLTVPQSDQIVSAVYADGNTRRVYLGVVTPSAMQNDIFVKRVIDQKAPDLMIDLERIAGIEKPNLALAIYY